MGVCRVQAVDPPGDSGRDAGRLRAAAPNAAGTRIVHRTAFDLLPSQIRSTPAATVEHELELARFLSDLQLDDLPKDVSRRRAADPDRVKSNARGEPLQRAGSDLVEHLRGRGDAHWLLGKLTLSPPMPARLARV